MDLPALQNDIATRARESAHSLGEFLALSAPALVSLAATTLEAIDGGGKVLVFGNGGSAADAQHLAGEFVGRFKLERAPLPAIALTTDTSILTCVGNDYGFNEIFSRQVGALARPGDVVIGITTSGNSPNVVKALQLAKERGCRTVGLTGVKAGEVDPLCDVIFKAPTSDTPRIQECHIAWIHYYCETVERLFVEGGAR